LPTASGRLDPGRPAALAGQNRTEAVSREPAAAEKPAEFEAVTATRSFLVEDSGGTLVEGELDRARAWGAQLAESLPVPAEQPSKAGP